MMTIEDQLREAAEIDYSQMADDLIALKTASLAAYANDAARIIDRHCRVGEFSSMAILESIRKHIYDLSYGHYFPKSDAAIIFKNAVCDIAPKLVSQTLSLAAENHAKIPQNHA